MPLIWNPSRWSGDLSGRREFLTSVADEVVDNWKESFGTGPPGREYRKRDGRIHVASVEGHPPNVDTGDLESSLRYAVQENSVDFYGTDYALYLNDSSVLNRPFIRQGFDDVDLPDHARVLIPGAG